MRMALTALLGLMLMAAPAFADDATPATQGQLAHQLAWRLDLIDDGGSVQDAINRLADYGVAPRGGWQADQALTNGVLNQVMHQVYASWDTNYPDQAVLGMRLPAILDAEHEQTMGFWKWQDNRWQWEHNRWEYRRGF